MRSDKFTFSKIIAYKDIQEFYALNPDCCKIARTVGSEGVGVSRIRDEGAGVAVINYRVRYLDDAGKPQELMHEWIEPVSHCAKTFEFPSIY